MRNGIAIIALIIAAHCLACTAMVGFFPMPSDVHMSAGAGKALVVGAMAFFSLPFLGLGAALTPVGRRRRYLGVMFYGASIEGVFIVISMVCYYFSEMAAPELKRRLGSTTPFDFAAGTLVLVVLTLLGYACYEPDEAEPFA